MNASAFRDASLASQFLKRVAVFSAVGAVATLGYLVLTNAAVSLGGIEPKAASVAIYLLLMPASFLGHRRITFASRGSASLEGVRFCAVHAINIALAYSVSAIAIGYFALPPWTAFLVISVIVPIVNFLVFHFWVFIPEASETRRQ